jgi:hypothetical protein
MKFHAPYRRSALSQGISPDPVLPRGVAPELPIRAVTRRTEHAHLTSPGSRRRARPIGTYALVVFDTPIAGSALGSTSGCGSFCATLGEHGKPQNGQYVRSLDLVG